MTSKPQLIYHQLDEPFFLNPYGENSGISALHDLYPGRPMIVSDSINRYDIEPEDPEGARRTFLNSKRETQEYGRYLVERAMADGGGDSQKVLTHAIDDPSSVINDPQLQSASMQTPQTINNGMPISEPPPIGPMTADLLNEMLRGRQMEGTARSEGLVDSPFVPGIRGIVENFTPEGNGDDKSSAGSDALFSQLFLAFVVILLLIGFIVLVKK